MDINLEEILEYLKDGFNNRARMRAIMLDLFPNKLREINILLNIYESGIPSMIKDAGFVDETRYRYYIQKLAHEYGMEEKSTIDGLNKWIDLYLGIGESDSLAKRYFENKVVHEKVPLNNSNNSNNSIPSLNFIDKKVEGYFSDYEIAYLGDGLYEIRKYIGEEKEEIVIPNNIKGLKIVGIGMDSFRKNKSLERLIIPEGISYIAEGAFSECTNLKEVDLPYGLKIIGKKGQRYNSEVIGAFQGAALKQIEFPEGLVEIREGSFSDCINLKRIEFSSTIQIIGKYAFNGCGMKEIKLPSSVVKIEPYSFCRCESLTEVYLSDGLHGIDGGAFKFNPSLKYLEIPESVQWIRDIISDIYKKNITIGCYPKTRAEAYARNNNIMFKYIS